MGILFYVSQTEKDMCFLNNEVVTYKGNIFTKGSRVYSWWFLIAIFAVVSMFFFQRFVNLQGIAIALAIIFSIVFAGVVFVVIMPEDSFLAVVAGVISFIFAILIFLICLHENMGVDENEDASDKRMKNLFVYSYYVFILLASIFAYLQI
jgi:hypothetical protein